MRQKPFTGLKSENHGITIKATQGVFDCLVIYLCICLWLDGPLKLTNSTPNHYDLFFLFFLFNSTRN
uniref:Uncharacterized protein n=1 Tax=Nelumbo nucifera TaxID=4432 RepID=A0A822XK39_NELNU|nr:TPA_asm: hypothetical protein HUJ06_022130 [Nelumbo nucifera]